MKTIFKNVAYAAIALLWFSCGSEPVEDVIKYEGETFVIDSELDWIVRTENKIKQEYLAITYIDRSNIDSVEIDKINSIDFFPYLEKIIKPLDKYRYDVELQSYNSTKETHPDYDPQGTMRPVYDAETFNKKIHVPQTALYMIKAYHQNKINKQYELKEMRIFMPWKQTDSQYESYLPLDILYKDLTANPENFNLKIVNSYDNTLFDEKDMQKFIERYTETVANKEGNYTISDGFKYQFMHFFFYYCCRF